MEFPLFEFNKVTKEEMNSEVIVVALDSSKEITHYALEWAVGNVIKPEDSLVVLAVLPSRRSTPAPAPAPAPATPTYNFVSGLLKKWGLGNGRKTEKHSSGFHGRTVKAVRKDVSIHLENVCMRMVQQLFSSHNKKANTQVKVVADAQLGSVAVEAIGLQAAWVVLDSGLKKEGDCCLKQLNCNIVIVDHGIPKILRAVNPLAVKKPNIDLDQCYPEVENMLRMRPMSAHDYNSATTQSSLGIESPVSDADPSLSESSSEKEHTRITYRSSNKSKSKAECPIDRLESPYFDKKSQAKISPSPPTYKKTQPTSKESLFDISNFYRRKITSPLQGKRKSFSGAVMIKSDMEKVSIDQAKLTAIVPARKSTNSVPQSQQRLENTSQADKVVARKDTVINQDEQELKLPQRTSSIRMAVSITMKQPPTPPPLCSICKINVPVLGKSPKKFSYAEIKKATDGFSSNNLLKEGGCGKVYKGVMPDGQVVAVKRHKALSAQGAAEFCAEVEVLSCVRHRNLVMLLGYCIETEWLLVYEFACNGSLDKHLYGKGANEGMAWDYRMKVAIGAARGLRYLHEDCRVGCVVHRDFRPSNILLTHDFEPIVGDFGLARWQVDGQLAEETRVIGAIGYLAPEYVQSGLITVKADVYAYGVMLLELLSGVKATEVLKQTVKQSALEWGHPLLDKMKIIEVLDPRLEHNYVQSEVDCMTYAAILCLSPSQKDRPRISKVLKILEGDIPIDLSHTHGSHVLGYPKQYLNDTYGGDATVMPALDNIPSTFPLQSGHRRRTSPSFTGSAYGDNLQNSAFEGLTPSNGHNLVNGIWDLNQSEVCISGEYEAYLQGSLAKFMRNLNLH